MLLRHSEGGVGRCSEEGEAGKRNAGQGEVEGTGVSLGEALSAPHSSGHPMTAAGVIGTSRTSESSSRI